MIKENLMMEIPYIASFYHILIVVINICVKGETDVHIQSVMNSFEELIILKNKAFETFASSTCILLTVH